MVIGFGLAVAFEVGEAAVGGAIGVAHHHDAFRLVQTDRHADLFEDEILLEVVAGRGESLRASGNDDHVGAFDALLLQKLSHDRVDAVIEASEDGSVGRVGSGGGVEMEDFAHKNLSSISKCWFNKSWSDLKWSSRCLPYLM